MAGEEERKVFVVRGGVVRGEDEEDRVREA